MPCHAMPSSGASLAPPRANSSLILSHRLPKQIWIYASIQTQPRIRGYTCRLSRNKHGRHQFGKAEKRAGLSERPLVGFASCRIVPTCRTRRSSSAGSSIRLTCTFPRHAATSIVCLAWSTATCPDNESTSLLDTFEAHHRENNIWALGTTVYEAL